MINNNAYHTYTTPIDTTIISTPKSQIFIVIISILKNLEFIIAPSIIYYTFSCIRRTFGKLFQGNNVRRTYPSRLYELQYIALGLDCCSYDFFFIRPPADVNYHWISNLYYHDEMKHIGTEEFIEIFVYIYVYISNAHLFLLYTHHIFWG